MPSNEVGPSHQELLRIIHVSHSQHGVSASRNVRVPEVRHMKIAVWDGVTAL